MKYTIENSGFLARKNSTIRPDEMLNGVDSLCSQVSFTYGDTEEEAISHIKYDKSLNIKSNSEIRIVSVTNIIRGKKKGEKRIEQDPTKTNKYHCLVSGILISHLISFLRPIQE